MKTYRKIIALSCLTLSVFMLNAQTQDEYNENVTVNVSFDPMVNDANKINENPTIFDTSFTQVDFSFDRIKRGYKTSLTFDTIKAATVKGEPTATLYNIHLKGGLGFSYGGKELANGFVPLLQASYTSLRDRKLLYGADFYSRSAIAGQKNYGHNAFTNDDISLWGKRIFNSYSVYSKAYYNYSRHYLYGEKYTLEDVEKKYYRNSFHNLGFDIGYDKLERDNSLQHNAKFNFNYTKNNKGARELDLHFLLDAYKDLNLFSNASNEILGLTFDYKHHFFKYNGKFEIPSQFVDFMGNSFKNNYALFNFSPYFIFDYNKFHIFASLGIVPSIDGHKSIQTLPTATISFELIQQLLSLYGGLKSESIAPTLHQTSLDNPFILANSRLEDMSKTSFFAKAFLNVSRSFNLSLEGGLSSLRNQGFYINYSDFPFATGIVYDNAKRYYATLETKVTIGNSFVANISATYQKLDRDDNYAAWYNPAFTLLSKLSYNYKDKLNVTLAPTFKTKTKALVKSFAPNSIGKEKDIKAMVDVNLYATYQYTENWSIFLNLENIGFQQYMAFYNYPVYQFTILAGASYRF
ncbi:MAG: hypothetical protein IJ213_03640 [Bacteroidales bacterium]|nr:hypothetical protein [Bacteroidales bacterium]